MIEFLCGSRQVPKIIGQGSSIQSGRNNLSPTPGCSAHLLVLEGLDGVGKTTQARKLALALARCGFEVVLTREPSHGPWGRQLRELLSRKGQALPPEKALELFLADRRDHVDRVIKPALAANRLVITDRYYFSTLAYQGAAGLDPEFIRQQHAGWAPPPDLVLVLEVPLEELARRLTQRIEEPAAVFEKLDFLARVQQIWHSFTDPCLRRIDGRGTPEEVHQRLWELVCTWLGLPARCRPLES